MKRKAATKRKPKAKRTRTRAAKTTFDQYVQVNPKGARSLARQVMGLVGAPTKISASADTEAEWAAMFDRARENLHESPPHSARTDRYWKVMA